MDSYLPPSYQSILIAFALLGFLVGCRSDMVRDQPFDCDLFGQVKELDGRAFEPDLPYALVLYFRDVDCTTCMNRDLVYVRDFLEAHPQSFQPVLVTHDRFFLEQGDNPDLRKLKRVGRLGAPILIEPTPGLMGFDQSQLALIDLAQNKLVLQYSTRLEVDRWPEFQKQLEAFLPRH